MSRTESSCMRLRRIVAVAPVPSNIPRSGGGLHESGKGGAKGEPKDPMLLAHGEFCVVLLCPVGKKHIIYLQSMK